MTLDYSTKGKVHIKMLDSVAKMLQDLPEEFDGEASTPAGNGWREESTVLPHLCCQNIVHMQASKTRSSNNGLVFM
jgi:hypothetical protein